MIKREVIVKDNIAFHIYMMIKMIMLSIVNKKGGGEKRVGEVRSKFCSSCIELKLTAT